MKAGSQPNVWSESLVDRYADAPDTFYPLRARHKTLGNGHAPNARDTRVIQPQPTFALRDHAYMPLLDL
jgi:hypothetical protein